MSSSLDAWAARHGDVPVRTCGVRVQLLVLFASVCLCVGLVAENGISIRSARALIEPLGEGAADGRPKGHVPPTASRKK